MTKRRVDERGRRAGTRGCEWWLDAKARWCNAHGVETRTVDGARRQYCRTHTRRVDEAGERVANDGGDDVGL